MKKHWWFVVIPVLYFGIGRVTAQLKDDSGSKVGKSTETSGENKQKPRWAAIVLDIVDDKADEWFTKMASSYRQFFSAKVGVIYSDGYIKTKIQDVVKKYGSPDKKSAEKVKIKDGEIEDCDTWKYEEITFYTKKGLGDIIRIEGPMDWLADGIRKTAREALAKSK